MRKNDTQDLVPNFSRPDGFKYSFFNRVVDAWNVYPIILENQTVLQLLKEMF